MSFFHYKVSPSALFFTVKEAGSEKCRTSAWNIQKGSWADPLTSVGVGVLICKSGITQLAS